MKTAPKSLWLPHIFYFLLPSINFLLNKIFFIVQFIKKLPENATAEKMLTFMTKQKLKYQFMIPNLLYIVVISIPKH